MRFGVPWERFSQMWRHEKQNERLSCDRHKSNCGYRYRYHDTFYNFGFGDDIGCITEPDSVCITAKDTGYDGADEIKSDTNVREVEACRSYCRASNAAMFTLHTGYNARCVCKNPTNSFQKKTVQGSTSGNTFCFRELIRVYT